MNYKLYIFDMGGVLAQNFDVRPSINKHLNISSEKFHDIAGDQISKLSDGRITSNQFWEVFSKRSGYQVKEDLFAKFFRPEINLKTKEIIKGLKKKARVVCGTNTLEPHYIYHSEKGQYDIFDKVYASNKIGISKPDNGFYKYILDAEKVIPGESIFIDDMKENVDAAKSIGIKSILFKDPESLIELLKTL